MTPVSSCARLEFNVINGMKGERCVWRWATPSPTVLWIKLDKLDSFTKGNSNQPGGRQDPDDVIRATVKKKKKAFTIT